MAVIVDSYSEANQDDFNKVGPTYGNTRGQSFTGDGGVLNSTTFYLRKYELPTGNAVVKIYTHSGTYGSTSVGTGVALATSGAFDVSTLTTSYQLIAFTFSGDEKIILGNGTYYVVAFEYSGGDDDNTVAIGLDSSTPAHSGNWCAKLNSIDWSYSEGEDLCFYVYKDDPPTTSTTSSSSSTSTTSSSSTSTTSSSSSISTTSSSTSTTSSSSSSTSTTSSSSSTSSTSTTSSSSSISTTSSSTSTTSSSSSSISTTSSSSSISTTSSSSSTSTTTIMYIPVINLLPAEDMGGEASLI